MKVGGEFPNLNTAVGSSATFAGLINGELNGGNWDATKPHVVIIDEADKKYIMEADFTPDGKAFSAFITQYFNGEIEPFIKSEPVPENQGALKKVQKFFLRFFREVFARTELQAPKVANSRLFFHNLGRRCFLEMSKLLYQISPPKWYC